MSIEEEIKVVVTDDHMKATIEIPESFPAPELSVALISQIARDAGVTSKAFTEQLERSAELIVERFKTAPHHINDTLVEGVPKKDPVDAHIEWMEGFDPSASDGGAQVDVSEDDEVDFYNRVAYINVTKGTHIANVQLPHKGSDGRRLDGAVMKVGDPQPLRLQIHESMHVGSGGRMVANEDGVLQLRRNELRISRVLDISENVDFNTGNVDFDGSVTVRQNVRDKFVVRATEDVTVYGLIESANILCGGTFVARTGIAARETANIIIGGNARAGYLNNVRGRIKGDLAVQSELLNCELIISGALNARNATMIGGHLILAGKSEIGTLGSEAYTDTTISIGCTPTKALQLSRLSRFRHEASEELDDLEKKIHNLRTRPTLTPSQETKLQELSFRSFDLRDRVTEADEKRLKLSRALHDHQVVDLTIRTMLYPKTILRIGDTTIRIREEVEGPVHIILSSRGQVQYKTGVQDYKPMGEIADVSRPEAA